jgi:hypothetical protein
MRAVFLCCLDRRVKTADAYPVFRAGCVYWGWKVFESPGVEPVFPEKRQAIDYAETRACFRCGEIRVLDARTRENRQTKQSVDHNWPS